MGCHTCYTFVMLDTLGIARELEDAGFEQAKAEAVAKVFSKNEDHLVTREYLDARLARLEVRMYGVNAGLLALAVAVLKFL